VIPYQLLYPLKVREDVLLMNANLLNARPTSMLQDSMSEKKKDIRSSNYS